MTTIGLIAVYLTLPVLVILYIALRLSKQTKNKIILKRLSQVFSVLFIIIAMLILRDAWICGGHSSVACIRNYGDSIGGVFAAGLSLLDIVIALIILIVSSRIKIENNPLVQSQ